MVRLPHIQGSSGVIISGSPQMTLCVSQRELSVTPKPWPEKERRGGGKEARSGSEAKEEERKDEALPGSTVVQGTTG